MDRSCLCPRHLKEGDYGLFFRCWPWLGLWAVIVLSIVASTTNVMLSDTSKSWRKDPTFAACCTNAPSRWV